MDKRGYYFKTKLNKTAAIQIAKFIVFVVGDADKPQLRIGDVDMRNNMRYKETRRPQ